MTDEDGAALDELLLELIRDGKPIQAAREARSITGCGLRESVDYVARLARTNDIELPAVFRF